MDERIVKIPLEKGRFLEMPLNGSDEPVIEERVRVEQGLERRSTIFPSCVVALLPSRIYIYQKRLFSSRFVLRHAVLIEDKVSGGSTDWKKSFGSGALVFSVPGEKIQWSDTEKGTKITIPLPENNILTAGQQLRFTLASAPSRERLRHTISGQ